MPPVLRLVTGRGAPIDLGAALGKVPSDAAALLCGVLRLDEPLDGALLVGASDGLRVVVDGRTLATWSGARPERDDDHFVALRLAAGAHTLVLELEREGAPWSVRVRLVDAALGAPRGATLELPGTDDEAAASLARDLVDVTLDRAIRADGYEARLRASFPDGSPAGVAWPLRVVAERAQGGELYRLDGEVPLGEPALDAALPRIDASEVARAPLRIVADAAGRRVETTVADEPAARAALAAAESARSLLAGPAPSLVGDAAVTLATIEFAADRVRRAYAAREPTDTLPLEVASLRALVDDLAAGRDPLRARAGIRRFAIPSPLDDHPEPFGVYVPPSYRPGSTRKLPLVVALHGMNGRPLSMIAWLFGKDDPARDGEWEDAHPPEVEPIDAFVVAPNGRGNAMYRELGEVDTLRVVAWMKRFFPVDDERVTITGPSMGGIGAAALALRFPSAFAAASPLCGYHSYFVRRDLAGRQLAPWERLLAEHRSNALWAENGQHLPMFIWHGRRDLPEAHSQVLIDRYEELHYPIEHEHPDVGHDVWRRAYADGAGLRWLLGHRREPHPREVRFRTDALRWADAAWAHVRGLAAQLAFGEVRARVVGRGRIEATSEGLTALAFDRDPALLDAAGPTEVRVDGQRLKFAAREPIELHRAGSIWERGAAPRAAADLAKRAGLAGPIRDVFLEPLVFVVGTDDPAQTRANLETARAWARVRAGVDVDYPIVRDVDLDDATAASHALVLVGNARSNRVLRALEPRLPFRVVGDAVVAGERAWRGDRVGVAFVHPNPDHPDRYVLVIEGTTPLGTYQAAALPDLLPDWMVYDADVAPARGGVILAPGKARAAGMFDATWHLAP